MKVLYLFNRIRVGLEEEIAARRDHDGHFFGMFRLAQYGVQANYLELEQFLPARLAFFLRRLLNIHYIHLPLFFKLRQYDLVFSSSAFGSLLAKVLLGWRRPHWIVFDFGIIGMIAGGLTGKQKALKFAVGRADGVITLSPGEERMMRQAFPALADQIKFFHLGVDTDFFTPDWQTPAEDFVLSPGRDPGRDVRMLAFGTTGLVPEVKITIRKWDSNRFGAASQHVKCYDFSPVALREQYQRAKLVILPLNTNGGLNDAMGCSSLVEAMAMGKAIIATRTETMATYIKHGENGWLVPEGDEQALRQAVEHLWNNPDLRYRLGQAARKFAVEHCTADLFARQLADYFKQNLAKSNER